MIKKIISAIMSFMMVGMFLVACTPKKDDAEENIRGFIERHYVADKDDLEACGDYVKNGIGIGDNLNKKDKEMAEYMTEEGFDGYRINRTLFYRFKLLYEKKCTSEIKDVEIVEKEKSDDMRRFNVKFNWIIKNDKDEIVKEHKVDKDIYLSEEHGSWLINQYNKLEILYGDFNFNMV